MQNQFLLGSTAVEEVVRAIEAINAGEDPAEPGADYPQTRADRPPEHTKTILPNDQKIKGVFYEYSCYTWCYCR